MTLTRVAHKRKVRASNAVARRSDRTFPNHQARCALLILLRFEFANEFRPRKANQRPPAASDTRRPRVAVTRPSSRRISARGLTPNRGDNVASPRGNARLATGTPPVTHMWCRRRTAHRGKSGYCREGGAVRIRQHSNRPVSLEATVLPDELSAKPSRPVLIASPPFIAALLIGLKGVLNPKVQVQARRDVTL
jgi:hypothetical protein